MDIATGEECDMTVIVARGLQKEFQVKRKAESFVRRMAGLIKAPVEVVSAVRDVNLSVEKGEMVAFLGPNGAGKSTTIKMLTGILHPSVGTASVLGLDPWSQRRSLARRIGTVFGQKSQLWLHLPPLDSFRLLTRIYELDPKAARAWIEELVELFELRDFLDVPVRKLSLGQRMRCEIAASLLHRPEVIFLDEPTIGLDPVAKASIRNLVRRVNRESGVTVFLTSHDAGDVEQVCRRAVVINHGTVVFDDSVNALRRDFLKNKEIGIRAATDIESVPELPGLALLKCKGCGAKFKLDTSLTPIDEVIGALMRHYDIEDITIENLSLENVIARIYSAQKEGG